MASFALALAREDMRLSGEAQKLKCNVWVEHPSLRFKREFFSHHFLLFRPLSLSSPASLLLPSWPFLVSRVSVLFPSLIPRFL